jgi:hypothetical protein
MRTNWQRVAARFFLVTWSMLLPLLLLSGYIAHRAPWQALVAGGFTLGGIVNFLVVGLSLLVYCLGAIVSFHEVCFLRGQGHRSVVVRTFGIGLDALIVLLAVCSFYILAGWVGSVHTLTAEWVKAGTDEVNAWASNIHAREYGAGMPRPTFIPVAGVYVVLHVLWWLSYPFLLLLAYILATVGIYWLGSRRQEKRMDEGDRT